MINPALLSAFHHHRRENWPRGNAAKALQLARRDVAANVRRYVSGGIGKRPYPAVTWYPVDSSLPASLQHRERLAYVERPEHAGLRLVGIVQTEPGGRNDYFTSKGGNGWFTDPYGDHFRDGTGLCWGVVYQLPARDGKARFVAGFQYGGTDSGPTLDLASIYESESEAYSDYSHGVTNHDDARDAARVADQMAESAAEKEREYQTAFAAGSRYAEKRGELAEIRKGILSTIRDMKAHCGTLRALPDTLKARLRASLESDLVERADLHRDLSKLVSGDFDRLVFYPDSRLQAAFCEGAGLKTYPA